MVLKREKCIFKFSPFQDPAIKVSPNTSVEIETYDCFSDQIKTNDDTLEKLDWDRVNPATGPIFIEGAEPGDTLKVIIEKIEIENRAVIATGKELGVLGDLFNTLISKVVNIENNEVIFSDKIRIPIKPMIGVIGVAPSDKEINCGTPGEHGGNIDTKLIAEGSIVYFPVFVKGALFALGDLHACMGDGEVCVSGTEVNGKVTVRFEVLKGLKINSPIVVNNECVSFIASASTLDEAANLAVRFAHNFIKEKTDMSSEDIVMLFSLIGDVEVSQIVDPLRTARFTLPYWIFEKLNIKL
ncbi:acetamidase/formamidase family protein [Caldanaerobius polysaccharolyticus]|uniref:acetamidase/formamidase family protein n=1 Tax=Caldanaerobius polysaccharolyticus TaxID=44256 RepID=UPI00047998C7|nr:acetamidase/formamidase family protein [Caldanaerobius polysaccharolyticus]